MSVRQISWPCAHYIFDWQDLKDEYRCEACYSISYEPLIKNFNLVCTTRILFKPHVKF